MLQKDVDNKFSPWKDKAMIKQQSFLFAITYPIVARNFNFKRETLCFAS